MDAREQWQALQARSKAARRWLDVGDRDSALAEVDAALAIDPEFLVAQSLRELILADASIPMSAPAFEERGPIDNPPRASQEPAPQAPLDLPLHAPASPPGFDAGYARFEQRAKRRRVDHRLDAARAAIAERRLHDARAALDEVIDLDPNAPELAELTRAFDGLRRTAAAPRRGAWLAAALAFVATVLGASWLENAHALVSRPIPAMTSLVAAPLPDAGAVPPPEADDADSAPAPADVAGDAIGTAGRAVAFAAESTELPSMSSAMQAPPIMPSPPAPIATPPAAIAPPPAPVTAPQVAVTPPAIDATRPAVQPAVASPPAAVPETPPPEPDEAALVRQALQRYRNAYERLDAGSARVIWPAVDEGALARAFDGLESQTLTFDDCAVQLQNDMAAATCRGTASYVPKVGSRELHTEPRVWTFSLRKVGGEWKIEAARVER